MSQRITLRTLILCLIILPGLIRLPGLWRSFVQPEVLRAWNDPDEQLRLLYGAKIPYDAIRQAERSLDPAAHLLLVTPADDVKYTGYITYHRLLYYLAPRPVVWVSAAAPDGSWESRQWLAAELNPETLGEIAAAHNTPCLLALSTPPQLLPGTAVAQWDALALYQLDADRPCLADTPNTQPFWAGGGWGFRLAAALLTIFLLGDALLVGMRWWGYAAAPLEWLILAWFGGTVVLSLLLFWTGALGLELAQQQTLFTGLAVFWGGIRLFRKWRASHLSSAWHGAEKPDPTKISRPVPGTYSPTHWSITLFLALVILVNLVFVALLVMGRPFFIWDSWIGWSIKARILFLEGGITPALYAEPARAITMQGYPLHLPLLYAWIYQWLGAPDDRLIGVVIWLYDLALVGAVYGGTRTWAKNHLQGWLAAATIASPAYILLIFASAYADGVLIVAAALTALYWRRWLEPTTEASSSRTWIPAAFCAATLPWIKQDGLLLLAAFILILLILWLFSLSTRHAPCRTLLLSTGLATTLISLPWYLFVRGRGLNVTVFLPLTPATFLANLERLPTIGLYQMANLFHPLWNFFWPLLGFLVVYRLLKRQRVSFLWGVVLVYVALTSLIFVFSDYPPFSQHILTSAYRLLAHVVALPLLAGGRGELEEGARARGKS